MITDAEMARLQRVTKNPKPPRGEKQWMLDLLRREGGRLTQPQLDEARQQGFQIKGIKAKP